MEGQADLPRVKPLSSAKQANDVSQMFTSPFQVSTITTGVCRGRGCHSRKWMVIAIVNCATFPRTEATLHRRSPHVTPAGAALQGRLRRCSARTQPQRVSDPFSETEDCRHTSSHTCTHAQIISELNVTAPSILSRPPAPSGLANLSTANKESLSLTMQQLTSPTKSTIHSQNASILPLCFTMCIVPALHLGSTQHFLFSPRPFLLCVLRVRVLESHATLVCLAAVHVETSLPFSPIEGFQDPATHASESPAPGQAARPLNFALHNELAALHSRSIQSAEIDSVGA